MTTEFIWIIGYIITLAFVSTDKDRTFIKDLFLFIWWPLTLGRSLRESIDQRK